MKYLALLLCLNAAFAARTIDLPLWRSTNGMWYLNPASGPTTSRQWGLPGDVPLSGDFDGDGRLDYVIWRPTEGNWYITLFTGAILPVRQWGLAGDIPVPGDYDGDGRTDYAVWRPNNGTWYITRSSTGAQVTKQWRLPNDVPIVADFDGDGKADYAVWRPAEGKWYITLSSTGAVLVKQWGLPGDIPVASDFDGDGRADYAVWRPSNGTWYVIPSSTGVAYSTQWGLPDDIPVARDYDGDGKADIAVWRPSNGTWYIVLSASPVPPLAVQWGLSNDIPLYRPVVAPPTISFGPGEYLVGTGIAAGRYYSAPAYACYWERLSGVGGTLAEIIANDFLGADAAQDIVDISASDLAFSTNDKCGIWFSTPRLGVQSSISTGTWLVGAQLMPGTYQATASYGCYWARLRNFGGNVSGIIANQFVSTAGPQFVTIAATDIGFATESSCGVWTRVSAPAATDSSAQTPAEIKWHWLGNRGKDPRLVTPHRER